MFFDEKPRATDKKTDVFREISNHLSSQLSEVKNYIKRIKDPEVELNRKIYDPFQQHIKDTYFAKLYKSFLESPVYIKKVNEQYDHTEFKEPKIPSRLMSTIQEGFTLKTENQTHQMYDLVTEDLLAPPPSNPPKP